MNRRWGFAAAMVVIAGLAVGLALVLRPSAEPGSANVQRLVLPIPRGFNSYPIPGNTGPGSGVETHVITNFRVPADTTIDQVFRRWTAAEDTYVLVKNHNYGPPSNAVALELEQYYRDAGPEYYPGPGPSVPPNPRLRLPLSPTQPWYQERLASGTAGYRAGYLRFHGYIYYVRYWIGPDAPAKDRAALLRALRSIRPTSTS